MWPATIGTQRLRQWSQVSQQDSETSSRAATNSAATADQTSSPGQIAALGATAIKLEQTSEPMCSAAGPSMQTMRQQSAQSVQSIHTAQAAQAAQMSQMHQFLQRPCVQLGHSHQLPAQLGVQRDPPTPQIYPTCAPLSHVYMEPATAATAATAQSGQSGQRQMTSMNNFDNRVATYAYAASNITNGTNGINGMMSIGMPQYNAQMHYLSNIAHMAQIVEMACMTRAAQMRQMQIHQMAQIAEQNQMQQIAQLTQIACNNNNINTRSKAINIGPNNMQNLANNASTNMPTPSMTPIIATIGTNTNAASESAANDLDMERIRTNNSNFGNNYNNNNNNNSQFRCDFCFKTFKVKRNFQSHFGTHLGFGFKCQYCNKICARKANLTIHERTHTGEKPFECDHCHKKFAQVHGLRGHIQRFHKDSSPAAK